MVHSIEGVYRDGKVELLEPAPVGAEGRVIVTFVAPPQAIDLAGHGIDRQQAADLHRRLTTFAEDWSQPEMDAYDAL